MIWKFVVRDTFAKDEVLRWEFVQTSFELAPEIMAELRAIEGDDLRAIEELKDGSGRLGQSLTRPGS